MNFRKVNFRSPAVLMVLGGVATLVLAVAVVMVLLRAGGAKSVTDNAALIGALVALGGVFTAQMVSIALDDRRTQEARDLEGQRAREAALQNYFEQVGELLIEKPLHRASPGDTLSTVVRAQTLSVLGGLDRDRKSILLLFLYESRLISKDKPVVSLVFANLSGANLSDAYLQGADMRDADLRFANLRVADLSEAYLQGADLSYAYLGGANLVGAKLERANLSDADLFGANLSDAYLSNADLRNGYLGGANLSGANLSGAALVGANLSDADLSGSDMTGAVVFIEDEERLHEAKSLEGATMPNGQKYEDWLKDREDRTEDAEND